MEKYAVIQAGGKQFKITEGSSFIIERQKALDIDVLFYFDGKKVHVGTPFLRDVEVESKLEDAGMDKKITIARFKSKSRYRKKKGHRQPISKVTIEKITMEKEVGKPQKKDAEEEKIEKVVKAVTKKRGRSGKVKKEK